MDYADIATTAVAEVQSLFKRVYLKALDAVPNSVPLTAQLNRTKNVKAGPDGLYFNVKLETGGKVANVPDGKLLPKASRPIRRTGSASLAHTYTVVGIGGQSIPLTSDTRNAFVANLKDQTQDAFTRVRLDLERQYNGDGDGILGLFETVASAPVYDIHQPYGISGAGPGTMLLIEGMEVACINPAGPTERDRQTITDVDVDNEQFTAGASFTGAVIGDYLVLCNDVDATGTDAVTNHLSEAAGINAVVATGDTFETIDQTLAGNRRWGATVVASSGLITEKKIANLEAKVMAASGDSPDFYYTTRGIVIEMQDQLAGLRRATMSADLKGGYKGLFINDRKVMPGDWCPKGHFFALCTKSEYVGMVDLVPLGMVDLDGATLHRVEGRHAYRADCWVPHEAIWYKRSCHGKITGLTDDDTIVR